MTIYDNAGKPIEVTDLAAAIEQADMFRGLSHADMTCREGDTARQAYWEHLYRQLLALQQNNPAG